MLGKDGLVAMFVVGGGGALDIGRQGNLAGGVGKFI